MTLGPASTALRDLIEQEAARPPNGGYLGLDWYQLAEQEADVFGIDPDDMPMMVTTWEAFEAFHHLVSGGHWDMTHQAVVDAAKAERPDLAALPIAGDDAWREFAAAFSPLTFRQSWQWRAKYDAYCLREGILSFRDGS